MGIYGKIRISFSLQNYHIQNDRVNGHFSLSLPVNDLTSGTPPIPLPLKWRMPGRGWRH
jgi:hypothetical protein